MPNLLALSWVLFNLALAVAYLLTVRRYRIAWYKLPEWVISEHNYLPQTKLTVLVPARNEAVNLLACLNSIANQNYPAHLFEVIIIDDASEDGTATIAAGFSEQYPNFKTINLGTKHGMAVPLVVFGKKAAIETGVAAASGELIVCTDADCEVPPNWLRFLANFYEIKQAKFIAAPVNFHREGNWLQRFQSLDFMGMMGVTGAGFQTGTGLLCNGANLAYTKAVFEEVGGFEGIDGLASGDDMLLLHKVAKRYPDHVFFLKNKAATVLTDAQPDLHSFLSQRLRWASKSRSYEDWQVTLRLVVVFLLCWAFSLNALLAIWFGWPLLALSFGLLSMKSAVDSVFLRQMANYFNRSDLMRQYWLSQLGHIAYILVVGTWANIAKQYEWKGRRVR